MGARRRLPADEQLTISQSLELRKNSNLRSWRPFEVFSRWRTDMAGEQKGGARWRQCHAGASKRVATENPRAPRPNSQTLNICHAQRGGNAPETKCPDVSGRFYTRYAARSFSMQFLSHIGVKVNGERWRRGRNDLACMLSLPPSLEPQHHTAFHGGLKPRRSMRFLALYMLMATRLQPHPPPTSLPPFWEQGEAEPAGLLLVRPTA
jgi:hypothetical protein